MANKLFVGGVAIAALFVLSIAIFSATDKNIPVAEVTVEMIAPYLDATQKMLPNLELGDCRDAEKTNFGELPRRGIRRNPTLEMLAIETAFLFRTNKTGDRLSKYIPIVELDNFLREFRVGDSPWGLYADIRLQKGIEPYLEEAKAAMLGVPEKKEVATQNAQISSATGTNSN